MSEIKVSVVDTLGIGKLTEQVESVLDLSRASHGQLSERIDIVKEIINNILDFNTKSLETQESLLKRIVALESDLKDADARAVTLERYIERVEYTIIGKGRE